MRVFAFALVLVLGALAAAPLAAGDGLVNPKKREIERIVAAAPSAPTVKPKAPRKVLVCCLNPTGYVHSATLYGVEALKAIAAKTGAFEVVVSNELSMFEPENLAQFDAVFFNNANNEIFLPADFDECSKEEHQKATEYDALLKASLADFIKSGKGVGVWHASVAIFRKWDEWGDIVGGRFVNHPWHREVTVSIEEPGHPLMKAFGGASEFKLRDEIYQVGGTYSREINRVLISIDMEKTGMPDNPKTLKREDGDYALSWIKSYGKGRVFYCAFGHDFDLYWNPTILQYMLDGIQFTTGDLEADMTPSAKK